MILVGDVHGRYEQLKQVTEHKPDETYTVLGDVGIGFANDPYTDPIFPPNVRILRGNHDNPDVFRKHPNALPDWGYDPKLDLFWISGGYSLDGMERTYGVDWWPEEEQIAYPELMKVIEAFADHKPKYVISHECPFSAQLTMFPHTCVNQVHSRTKTAMEQMFEKHQPEYWLFGHYHIPKKAIINETFFACCDKLFYDKDLKTQLRDATIEIKGIQWELLPKGTSDADYYTTKTR